MAVKKGAEKKTIVLIILVLLGVFLLGAGIKVYQDVFAGNVRSDAENKYLYVYTGKSFEERFERIKAEKLLRDPDALQRIISLTGYSALLKPGKYKLNAKMSNLDLMRMMVSGRQEAFDVVFRYAERTHDVASFWGMQLEADSNRIEDILNGSLLSDSLGLDRPNAILVFIPNTYNFYWNTSADKLMQRMIKEYRNFWDSSRISRAQRLQLSPSQVGTLASIVQKETNQTEEMPVVAGVYYNRLQLNMPLQADPTLLFAINDKSIRRVSGEMLQIESPFNTYVNKGLPPGPICVPSSQAMDAVLNLEHHKYIYFCAKEDFSGYHNFSASFAQHQMNARKYQRALDRRGVK